MAIAAAILLLVMRVTGQPMPREGRVLGAFMVMGFLNNVVPFTLIVWGQSQLVSGVASILNATTPVFSVPVAHWLTVDEKMVGGRVVGVVAGLAGVTVMMGADAAAALGDNVAAQLACVGAAIAYAFAGVYGRR